MLTNGEFSARSEIKNAIIYGHETNNATIVQNKKHQHTIVNAHYWELFI